MIRRFSTFTTVSVGVYAGMRGFQVVIGGCIQKLTESGPLRDVKFVWMVPSEVSVFPVDTDLWSARCDVTGISTLDALLKRRTIWWCASKWYDLWRMLIYLLMMGLLAMASTRMQRYCTILTPSYATDEPIRGTNYCSRLIIYLMEPLFILLRLNMRSLHCTHFELLP